MSPEEQTAADLEATTAALESMRAMKDGAYLERNKVVAAYARLAVACGCTVGIGVDAAATDAAWRFVLFADLPTGQVSWHFHQDELALFHDFPEYKGAYDGHSTEEKYNRLAAFRPSSLLGARLYAAKAAIDGRVAPLREADQLAQADIVTAQAAAVADAAKSISQIAAKLEQQSNATINQLVNTSANHEKARNDALNQAIADTLG